MDGNWGKLKLPRIINDGMVLQRNKAVRIWGWSEPLEAITLEFAGRVYSTVARGDGSWEVILDSMGEGGPYQMEIQSCSEQILLHNILVGDVFVCSGQSNMLTPLSRMVDLYEEEIARAGDNLIRYFAVPERYHFNSPQEDTAGGSWISSDPAAVLNFSAVAYFFAASLFGRYQIPIGLINASVGGIPIEAMMSEESLAGFPVHLEELEKFRDDTYAENIIKKNTENTNNWLGMLECMEQGLGQSGLPWFDENANVPDWSVMHLPATLEEGGLKDFCGSVWFRKEIDVPEEYAGLPAILRLGTIVDSDTAYLNGTLIGATTYRYPPRKYSLPAGLIRAGRNTLVTRVVSNAAEGEFVKDKPYRLEIGDRIFSLEGEWKYKVGAMLDQALPAETPVSCKPTGLYNGMIAPIHRYEIKGVLWYQGEANSPRAKEYEGLLPNLISDWRRKWKNSRLPFLLVQLPNFNKPAAEPGHSEWAELREAQVKALSVPDTAMAVTIDVGEWNDIHPLTKKPVGERLALASRKLVYGEEITASGPMYKEMSVEGSRIRIRFTDVGEGLVSIDGDALKQFAIAGADGRFVWAHAQIQGPEVVVWCDTVPEPVAVRYAWADNPEGANLYNKEDLPASPFRTDTW